jgi:hypothetical protein
MLSEAMPVGTPLVEAVKRSIPTQRWRSLRRATNRLRWLLKLRLLRHYGFPIWRRPIRALRYVLFDPEVESFSYDLANSDALARALAPQLGVNVDQVVGWMDEARTDPILTRDRGVHWSSKRRQPLGNRTVWYPIIRATKPRLVVEAGVHEGLGSEMILVALRRNAAEGHPGKLLSFDIFEDTGWLVAPELRDDNWEFVLESTLTGMQRALRGRTVDLFIHETPHTDETINHEVGVALHHSGDRGLVVIDSSGDTCEALRRICDSCDVACHYLLDEPRDHIVRSNGTNIAIFDRAAAARARVPAARPVPQESEAGSAVLAKLVVATAACYDALTAACEAAPLVGA